MGAYGRGPAKRISRGAILLVSANKSGSWERSESTLLRFARRCGGAVSVDARYKVFFNHGWAGIKTDFLTTKDTKGTKK
jgi:hypothetical protein